MTRSVTSTEEESVARLTSTLNDFLKPLFRRTFPFQEGWKHRPTGAYNVYVMFLGSPLQNLWNNVNDYGVYEGTWISSPKEHNYVEIQFEVENVDLKVRVYITDYDKLEKLKAVQSAIEAMYGAGNMREKKKLGVFFRLDAEKKILEIKDPIPVAPIYGLGSRSKRSTPSPEVHYSPLFTPISDLGYLLKRATLFGAKNKKWQSVTITTKVSNNLRIVTYSGLVKRRNKKVPLIRDVPCFVCRERPDADAVAASSVSLINETPVDLDWTPRANIAWWNSNRKTKRGFTNSTDEVVNDALYKWLSKCPISDLKPLSDDNDDTLGRYLRSNVPNRLRPVAFWLIRRGPVVQVYLKIAAVSAGGGFLADSERMCTFVDSNCGRVAAVPPILMQRYFIPINFENTETIVSPKMGIRFVYRKYGFAIYLA